MLFGASRKPTHVRVLFRPPSMAAESLSLACARESNHCAAGAARTAKPARRAKGRMPGVKRTHPRCRARREAPSSLRADGVLPTVHPWTAAKAARSPAPPRAVRGPFPSALRRSTEGREQERPHPRLRRGLSRSAGEANATASALASGCGFCGQDGRALALPGSLSAAARAWRKNP